MAKIQKNQIYIGKHYPFCCLLANKDGLRLQDQFSGVCTNFFNSYPKMLLVWNFISAWVKKRSLNLVFFLLPNAYMAASIFCEQNWQMNARRVPSFLQTFTIAIEMWALTLLNHQEVISRGRVFEWDFFFKKSKMDYFRTHTNSRSDSDNNKNFFLARFTFLFLLLHFTDVEQFKPFILKQNLWVFEDGNLHP